MRSPASTAKVPADRFKSINNSYGHEAGDEALRLCAAVARTPEALAGRLGGDEFALILECRKLPEAIEIAEALRQRLSAHPLQTHEVGHADLERGGRRSKPRRYIDQLLARADAALYEAKVAGRNRVVGADAELSARTSVVTHGIARASAV